VVPSSGKGHLFLRACKFHVNTVEKWVNDIFDFMVARNRSGAPWPVALHIQADGGPDCTPDSLPNIILFGRLWKSLGVAVLANSVYAPGLSAHGAIEHLWAPVARRLAGHVFSACVKGEDTPPASQTKLTKAERKEKEVQVFTKALEDANAVLSGMQWAGQPVNTTVIPCVPGVPTVTNDKPLATQPFGTRPRVDDFGTVNDFVYASAKQVRDRSEFRRLREECSFYYKHLHKRKLAFSFIACQEPPCPCRGSRLNWTSQGFLRELTALGGRLPCAVPSSTHSGHYKTLRDHFASALLKRPEDNRPCDYYLPSRIKNNLGWCQDGCKNFAFSSKTEAQRHKRLVHGRTATAQSEPQSHGVESQYVCEVCSEKFDSLWARKGHLRREHGVTTDKVGTVIRGSGRFDTSTDKYKPQPNPSPPLPVPSENQLPAPNTGKKRVSNRNKETAKRLKAVDGQAQPVLAEYEVKRLENIRYVCVTCDTTNDDETYRSLGEMRKS
jgi:DNA-directed RNA polymerase subunit RPC12/RpoP